MLSVLHQCELLARCWRPDAAQKGFFSVPRLSGAGRFGSGERNIQRLSLFPL
jgi:hypothetical protein